MNFSAFKELTLLPQGLELVNNFETDDSRWPMASLFLLSPSFFRFFPPYRGIKIRREILNTYLFLENIVIDNILLACCSIALLILLLERRAVSQLFQ